MSGSKVFFLGDSQLKRFLQSSIKVSLQPVVDLTESGASVARGLANLNAFLDECSNKSLLSRCSIVILLGTNDCKRLGHASAFNRVDFKKITSLTRRFFGTVILCKIPPIPRCKSQCHIDLVNRYINSFHSVENIFIVDLFSPFVLPLEASVNLRYFEKRYANGRIDLIHVNKLGFKIFLESFLTFLSS